MSAASSLICVINIVICIDMHVHTQTFFSFEALVCEAKIANLCNNIVICIHCIYIYVHLCVNIRLRTCISDCVFALARPCAMSLCMFTKTNITA